MNKLIKYSILLFLIFINLKTAPAQIQNALVLDGCTNYLEIPDNDLLDYNQTLSIECWIQPNCGDDNYVILSKQWCQGQFGYYLSFNKGKLAWSHSSTGSCSSPNFHQTINAEILTNQFTHVAVVHSMTSIKLFVNGMEVLSEQDQGIFGEIYNSSEPFRIGAYKSLSGTMTNYFSGLIDEVRVWDVELNETLIQQRKDTPLQGNEAGLILYLNMEQKDQIGSLVLENQSSYGSSLNAVSVGYTAYSPYFIDPEEYDKNIINLGVDTVLCSLPFSLSIPDDNYKSILWSNGSSNTGIMVLNPGNYSVIAETELCKLYHDTINIELSNTSVISNNYSICENDTIIINNTPYYQAGIYYDTISSSGIDCDTIIETSISISPSSSNFLQFETCQNSVINYQGMELAPGDMASFLFTNSNGCDSIVTVNIELSSSNNSFLGNDTVICSSQYYLFSPNENTLWSDGTIGNNININSSGIHYAEFLDSLGCINSDTIHIEFLESGIYVPNAFSPNKDGFNDCLKPLFSNNFETDMYKFSVYSRWGEKVFETDNINECWDGDFNGKPLDPGIFVWVIDSKICNKPELLKGSITLLK